jgi:hypothetical protein
MKYVSSADLLSLKFEISLLKRTIACFKLVATLYPLSEIFFAAKFVNRMVRFNGGH